MACEQPGQLKAIVSIYASDNRYTDDVHYRGGIRKFVDLVDYCHYMTPMSALPPVPALWADDGQSAWRDEWKRRIEGVEPWVLRWLEHQQQDDYWAHGSVMPDYDRIICPTMLITGWADGYTNIAYRLTDALRTNEVPHRVLAWWDRWLRGVANGVDDGLDGLPALTCFVRSSTRPSPVLDTSRGRVDSRAVAKSAGLDAHLGSRGASAVPGTSRRRRDRLDRLRGTPAMGAERRPAAGRRGIPHLGMGRGVPCLAGTSAAHRHRQRGRADRILVGAALRRVRGRHLRTGLPRDAVLDACAYRFEPGQRIRLAIAGSDWPNTAAAPRPVTMTVHGRRLELPVWQGPSPYDPPVLVPGGDADEDAGSVTWRVERDVLGRTTCRSPTWSGAGCW
jgi:hypothetical protein